MQDSTPPLFPVLDDFIPGHTLESDLLDYINAVITPYGLAPVMGYDLVEESLLRVEADLVEYLRTHETHEFTGERHDHSAPRR